MFCSRVQSNPDFTQSLLEFIHILERRLIDPLLYDSSELVIDQIALKAVRGHKPGEIKSGVLCSNSSMFCAPMHWCTVPLKHKRVISDTFDSRKYYSK